MGEDRHLHRTLLAYVNQVFQQISGINLITYYAATIYQEEIGLDGLTSRALAAANGTGMKSLHLNFSDVEIKLIHHRILRGFMDRCFYDREIWPASAVSTKIWSSVITC